jgi:anaphase-promoting complex subunit 10
VYLDHKLDESYTPTKMVFAAGMGEYDLVEFAEWRGENPRGWVDVNLQGVGEGGGGVLRAMVVQVRVLENHQNGKDTHVRGVQIFARDERVKVSKREERVLEGGLEDLDIGEEGEEDEEGKDEEEGETIEEADWMGEPELR